MIEQHNKVVGVHDKIYFLGDIAMGNATSFDTIMSRLNGEKVLIKGNHDGLNLSNYVKWFKDIRATHVLDRFLISHIPVHPDSLGRWKANLHGHTHYRDVEISPHHKDTRYYNLSVEKHDYSPVDFEAIRSAYKDV
jgi:calcineurin-like phosphoesterase family protein